jgi:predicted nucleic acid-binding Zn ribbon protein
MAICSGCGENIEDDVKFCSKCGKAVDSVSENINRDTIAFCSGCGEKIENDVKFCSKCGKAVDSVSANNKKQGKKNVLLLVSFIVGTILLIVVGLLLFAPIIPVNRSIFGIPVYSVNKSLFSVISDSLGVLDAFKDDYSMQSMILYYLVVIFISFIAAVILNLFAWVLNNAKVTLAAAIMYGNIVLYTGFNLLSPILLIIPMVLCFIAYRQIKKKNAVSK